MPSVLAQTTPPAPTITSSTSGTYGDAYTATASTGPSTGALVWTKTGGTATNGAIDASSGAVTADSSGTIIFKVKRLGDGTYADSPYSSTFTVTLAKRAITITRGGTKVYDGTTTPTGVTATLASGTLAPGDAIGTDFGLQTSPVAASYSVQPATLVVNTATSTNRSASYTISLNGSFVVSKRAITVSVGGTRAYDGTTSSTGATASITTGTLASGDSDSYTFTATSSANVGTYSAIVIPAISSATAPTDRTSSYTVTKAAGYTITKATPAAPTITSSSSATYGTAYTATASSGPSSGALAWALGTTTSTAPSAAVNATSGAVTTKGTGDVYLKVMRAGNSNYTDSPYSGDFHITYGTRAITATVAGSKTYNGTTTPTGATASITSGTLSSGDSIHYAYANTSSANAGSYPGIATITVSNTTAPTDRTPYYAITQAGAYAINGVTTTFTISPTSYTYNGAARTPTITPSPAAATFTKTGATTASAIGSYTITATATGNYAGTNSSLNWSILAETVAPTAPTTVTKLGATATTLTVTWSGATDNVGVTQYEMFVNGVSQGTTTSTSMSLTGLSPGTRYAVTVKAGDASGNWSPLSTEYDFVFDGVPFIAAFESSEGYVLGSLSGQNGWTTSGTVNVASSPTEAGEQAVSIPAASPASFATRAFVNSSSAVTFADFFALPAATTLPSDGIFFETDVAEVALTGSGSTGVIQVFNGNGSGGGIWVTTAAAPALGAGGVASAWMRITVRADYVNKKWDLYYNGNMVASNLGFLDNSVTAFGALALGGHSSQSTSFDELMVSFDNPLFVDADSNGLDDAWELRYFGHLGNSASADPDGDGLTNAQEQTAGSNPIDPYNGRALLVGNVNAPAVTYTYDGSGRIKTATYLTGATITFTFDAAGNLTNSVQTQSGPISSWRTLYSLPADGTGSGADSAILAGDGLTNLEKYAFGFDPHLAVNSDQPAISLTPIGTDHFLTLTYRRPDPQLVDIIYTVQVSADGTTWTSAPTDTVDVSATTVGGIRTIVVRDATPSNGSVITRRMRLKIERRTN